jgi:PAS domain S-box-containing protein
MARPASPHPSATALECFMKLNLKFSGVLAVLLALLLGGCAWIMIEHQEKALNDEVLRRAQTVLSFGQACRDYARNTLAPAVGKHSKPMIFEAESATFVARGTFDEFRKRMPDYSFREAALNPLNEVNRADADEEAIIRSFQADSGLPQVAGFRFKDGREQFYVARPIAVERRCLQCHSSPEAAPPEVSQRYGTEHGYGWKEGEINSAVMVTVPAGDIRSAQTAVRWKVLGLFGGLALGVVGIVAVLFGRIVSRRVRQAAAMMERIRAQPTTAERINDRAHDEIGLMASAFNRMADSLSDAQTTLEKRVSERTNLLAEANQALTSEILERKRAEEELRYSELRTRMIVENALDGVITMNAEGLITGWNAQAKTIFGWSAQEVIGRVLADTIIPVQYRQAHTQGLRHFLTNGEGPVLNRRLEITALHHDGHEIPIELAISPLKSETSVTFSAFIRDIAERKRSEDEQHKAKEAAEAANRAKSEFLANMSHEIRTPMNGIMGMTELALDTPLTPEQRDYLGMIKSSSHQLLAVINDILDFSKIEAGQLELDIAEFELPQSVGTAMRTLAIGAQQKGLELACQIAADVPEALVGDAGRLGQVLVNLVGNAVKFTEHGEVVVRVENEECAGDEVRLHFTIQDTGIGIPAEKQAVIFEAFAQADSSTTRKFGGTGLGLAISTQLVALMGGRLWVESEPGRGSTFHFTARLCVGHGSVARRIRIPPPKLDGTPVLVVDDNATNRQILEEVLRRWKMRPILASGGAAALAHLEQAEGAGTSFPLVLLDLHMPDVDGFAVAERIKASPAHARAAVLMLTSSGRPGDVDRCRELGIAAHLLKPVAQGELLEAVVRALHLSLERAGGRQTTAREVVSEKRRPLRILLAEDNLVNQRLAVGLLEKCGHAVVIAADGKEALAALERESFDLMFMDVQMPEMGGFEATACIRDREKKTGRHLPIIAMTAHAMKGDRERCLASGMDEYISKPVLAAELIRAIDEVLAAGNQDLTAPANERAATVFDQAASLQRAGGDEQRLGPSP